MVVLFTTLGFDEKFQVRAFMRWFRELESVVVIGSFSEERAKKALNSLLDVANKANVKYDVLEVNPYDTVDMVVKIGGKIEEYKGKELVFNLSGGMRVISLTVLLVLSLKDVDAKVEVETEDMRHLATLNVRDFRPLSVSEEHLKVLSAVKAGYNSVNSIHKYLDLPLSTVWRRVKDLKEMGLVDENMRVTFRGELVLSTSSFSLERKTIPDRKEY
ncbi:CRISPR-associated CARF protein Csa3 [Stygiolobus caldivivus]|uniref:CRISPR-associated protein n=1 Tax=Stygiolobus caldivivus TaxID=2824673 RepID=A0A8D5ZIN8_9CREN|nr:CRISPR-associated CARF protein Csa3 [Stygiolobus caldivivus]BCU69796.1 CRISPR-associated protein [Stygiolobus caldivivus]